MANIANLSVSITARTAKFLKGMQKARTSINRFARDTSRSIKTIGGLGLAFGGLAAGGGLTLLIGQQFKAIDATSKLADKLGLTTEALTAYQFAAKIVGVEQGQLETGFAKLQRSVGDARNGLTTAKRAFADLGLTYEDIINLSPEEQIKTIADAFTSVDNQVVRTNAVLNIFGRSGLGFIKLFEKGRAGLEGFEKEAEKLGVTFSRVDGAKVEEANDAITRLRALIQGLAKNFAIQLAPALSVIVNRFVKARTEGDNLGKFASNSINNILDAVDKLKTGLNFVTGFFQGFRSGVELIAAGFAKLFSFVAKGLGTAFNPSTYMQAISSILEGLRKVSTKISELFGFEPVSVKTLDSLIGDLNAKASKNGLQRLGDDLDDLAKRFFDASQETGKRALDNLTAPFDASSTSLRSKFKEIQAEAAKIAKDAALSVPQLTGEAGELPGLNKDKNKGPGSFEQIDLSKIIVGGIQGGKTNEQRVMDPQLETTNELLAGIKSKISSGGAVAV